MSQAYRGNALSPTAIGLKVGDQGSAVGELQHYLARFGYLPINATLQERLKGVSDVSISEVFDNETAEALSGYQAFYGLSITGKLDESTVAQMAVPRCGVPDIWQVDELAFGATRFVVSGLRWNTFDLECAFVNFTTDSARRRIRRSVAAAFRTWSEVSSFTFNQAASVGGATQIRIQFATGSHGDGTTNDFDGPNGVLAHGFYPPSDGLSGGGLAGDIHFDDAETWNTAAVVPSTEYDLQTLAIHEIGHVLGLQHSAEPAAIMFGTFSLGTPKRTLHQDDIDGIRAIYGQQTRVPHVQESRPAIAAANVLSAGLVPAFTGVDGPNSWVWRQSPRWGVLVDIGSTVTMQLRNGPIP
jgi:hypothetical protein